jgi:hypothetical protein
MFGQETILTRTWRLIRIDTVNTSAPINQLAPDNPLNKGLVTLGIAAGRPLRLSKQPSSFYFLCAILAHG